MANLLHANWLTVGDTLAFPIWAEASCLINGRMSNKNDGCAYRKSNPAISMMQSAQYRTAENASGCLDGT
jgi:hypothetical protein